VIGAGLIGLRRSVQRGGESKAWLHDVLDGLDLPLCSWHAAPKRHIIRIEPESVTGRRFHVLDAPSRHMPTGVRRAALE
jgi:hypothetical protein